MSDQPVLLSPAYRLIVDGKNITPTINARLISLSLEESRGDEADQLELVLSDHDGALDIPRKGVKISLSLGWAGGDLVDKGTFTVDEAEHSGAPDILTLRARSADLAQSLRGRRDQSWHGLTLGQIVNTLAERNGLRARIDADLASRSIAHIDQTNESDANFLTRLGKRYDAVATVKFGRLLFLPINGSKTSKGKVLPTIAITRASGDSHRYAESDRDAYIGVKAFWHNTKKAGRKGVVVPSKPKAPKAGADAGEHHYKNLKETYATEADALAAAKAEWQRIQRGMATFSLTLAVGVPQLTPQSPVTVQGFKRQIDGTTWLATRVTHRLDDSGLTTSVECETGISPS